MDKAILMTMLRKFVHIGLVLWVQAALAQPPDSFKRMPEVTARLALTTDPATREIFDPREAAWDYPQGTYLRLQESAARMLSDDALVRAQDVRLADLIQGWRGEQIHFAISSAKIDESVGKRQNSTTGVRSAAEIKLCNQRDNCAYYSLSRRDDGVHLDFLGTFDVAKNRYPQPTTQVPFPRWRWDMPGSEGAEFANYLGSRGVKIVGKNSPGRDQCEGTQLGCEEWRGGTLVGCRLDCYAAQLPANR